MATTGDAAHTGKDMLTLRLDDGTTRQIPLGYHDQSSVFKECDTEEEMPLIGIAGADLDIVLEFMAKNAADPIKFSRMVHKFSDTDTMVAPGPNKVEVEGEVVDMRNLDPTKPEIPSLVPDEIPISLFQTGNLKALGLPEWAIEWIEAMDTAKVFTVLQTAYDLGVRTLTHLAAARIACMQIRMTDDALRRTFNEFNVTEEDVVRDDMTPEQKTEARQRLQEAKVLFDALQNYDSEEAKALRKEFGCFNVEWTPHLVFLQKADRIVARRKAAEQALQDAEAQTSPASGGAASGAGSDAPADDTTFMEDLIIADMEEDEYPPVPESMMFLEEEDLRNTITEPNFELERLLATLPDDLFKVVMFYA